MTSALFGLQPSGLQQHIISRIRITRRHNADLNFHLYCLILLRNTQFQVEELLKIFSFVTFRRSKKVNDPRRLCLFPENKIQTVNFRIYLIKSTELLL
jgi:hypothetical protein